MRVVNISANFLVGGLVLVRRSGKQANLRQLAAAARKTVEVLFVVNSKVLVWVGQGWSEITFQSGRRLLLSHGDGSLMVGPKGWSLGWRWSGGSNMSLEWVTRVH